MAKKGDRSPSPVDSAAEEEEEVYEVEKITGHKDTFDNKQRVSYEFLVRWKNYPPSADTWEPRDSLVEGAESILVDYIRKQEKRGVKIWDDGTKKRKMGVSTDERPLSKDSSLTAEPSKKKKRESMAEDSRNEGNDREPSQKKARKEARKEELLKSPTPPAVPKASVEKAHADRAPRSPSSTSHKEKLAPMPPIAKTANQAVPEKSQNVSESEFETATLAEIKAKLPQVTTDENLDETRNASPLGSFVYRDEGTWEHLLRIDTLEQDPGGAVGYRWAVKWNNMEGNEWISNAIARRKFPQRALDFYEDHLKFKLGTEGEDDIEANGMDED